MIQLNNMNNEPMMFINTVTKINNFSENEKKENKVDSVIINKVNELVTKYNNYLIKISQITLADNKVLEGIIKGFSDNYVLLKTFGQNEKILINDIISIKEIDM